MIYQVQIKHVNEELGGKKLKARRKCRDGNAGVGHGREVDLL